VPALIVEVLAANVAFVAVALALGEPVLRLAEAAVGGSHGLPSLTRLGAAVLAGFGTCALGGIVLAAAHLFRWQAFAACGAVAVVGSRRHLVAYGRAATCFLARSRGADPLVLAASAVALVAGGAAWLAALAPPESTDELAYHLPEARTLAETHALHLTLGGDRIYGNLPTLAETLWGEALTLRGPPVVHVVHVTIVVAFALLAAGVARTLWGSRAAALAVAGIALFPGLMENAVTGYVDAAGAAFEAGSALVLVVWALRREPGLLGSAAVLLGFGLGIKYTALPTAVLAFVLVGAVAVRERHTRPLLGAVAVAVAGCGYWYVKNLVRFGNPVFPFALGHPGVTDATYRYFVGTVHAYKPRSLTKFLDVPSEFASDPGVTAYLALVLAPLALLARGPWRAAALLLAYVATYTTWWYWFGSSQTRFLMSAVLIAIVLGAAAIGAARGLAGVAVAAVVAGGFATSAKLLHNSFDRNLHEVAATWLQTQKSRYALGLESTSEYLHHYFGCQVDAVDDLARRNLRGAVGLWELAPPPDYPRHNLLTPLHITATTPAAVRTQLRDEGFRYVMGVGNSAVGLSSNPAAQPVLAAARPFWHHGDCTLFRLDLGRRA
jgi:hypothetical protein